MINFIVYGHTDYLEILNIQTDHMVGKGRLTLFVNNNDLDLQHLYSKYDNIVLYDSNLPYSGRILSCLKKIDFDYFIFIHDIDILLNIDEITIDKLYQFLTLNNYDRIDLKHTDNLRTSELIKIDTAENPSKWLKVMHDDLYDGNFLVRQKDPSDYIYNVNPSIWKKDSFIELLTTFPNKSYRDIESMDVQNFSVKYDIFKLYSSKHLLCGYFKTLDFFKYLHISHSGKLLPLNDTYTTIYGQSYVDVKDEYIQIVDKYDLKKSKKWIQN